MRAILKCCLGLAAADCPDVHSDPARDLLHVVSPSETLALPRSGKTVPHTGEKIGHAAVLRPLYFERFLDLSKVAYVFEATINI